MTVDLDWGNLGSAYHKLPFCYISYYKDGKWNGGQLTEGATLHISEASPALRYGQQALEDSRAYRTKDGSVQLFRSNMNAERLQRMTDRLPMPQVPAEKFIDAAGQVVHASEEFVPPYGTSATPYLRSLLISTGDAIGVHPANEYIFTIFTMPVGSYFRGGLVPTNFSIQDEYDRAVPNGTGAAEVGGNYAVSPLPGKVAHDRKFSDVTYLDPATHTKVEEVSSANFFGITADNEFIIPFSPSTLPSITEHSLLYLAEHRFGTKAIQGDVKFGKLDKFVEAGTCGTAAVISPIGGVRHGSDFRVFYNETEVGPVTRKLYDELVSIRFNDIKAPESWIYRVS